MDIPMRLADIHTDSHGRNGQETAAALVQFAQQSVVDRWLGTRAKSTQRAYRKDLEYFARWLRAEAGIEVDGPDAAAEALLSGTSAVANTLTEAWVASQMKAGLSSATINRRLAALRSLAKLARRLGRSTVVIDTEGPRDEPVRDVRGPDAEGIRAMLAAAGAQRNRRKALRDVAILALLANCALRRSEVAGLNVHDVDIDRLHVKRKGRRRKAWVPLPANTRAALAAWLDVRKPAADGVFHSVSHRAMQDGATPARITDEVVWKIVRAAGRKAGLTRECWPHALRHTAITTMLDAGFDVRKVRDFSGHATIQGVIAYDDARTNWASDISEAMDNEVFGSVPTPPPQP